MRSVALALALLAFIGNAAGLCLTRHYNYTLDHELESEMPYLGKRLVGEAVIGVYFHVVTKEDGTGTLTKDMLNKQMTVLKKAFQQTNFFKFRHLDTRHYANNSWHTLINGTRQEFEMKRALARKAPSQRRPRVLNVYILNTISGDSRLSDNNNTVLGWSVLPSEVRNVEFWKDGVVISYRTVPDNPNPFHPYHQGMTLVHEGGHFLGLFQ
jgi:hypothetical protein